MAYGDNIDHPQSPYIALQAYISAHQDQYGTVTQIAGLYNQLGIPVSASQLERMSNAQVRNLIEPYVTDQNLATLGVSKSSSTGEYTFGGASAASAIDAEEALHPMPPPAAPGASGGFNAGSPAPTSTATPTGAPPAAAQVPFPTTALTPGMTGASVQQLQNFLVSQGYMTQAQVNTGYGTYGPQTTAAVLAYQRDNGVDNSTGPGYWGPRTIQAATSATQASPGGAGAAAGGSTGGIGFSPTGDPQLDEILKGVTGVANNLISTGYTLPATLNITPELVSDFLNYAHQAVDPYTKQLLDGRITDVNANLKNLTTQYGNNMGQLIQDFGTSLATEQNEAGGNGTAFSGMRALTENNMAASTNRQLASTASTAATDIGSAARSAASDVGAANAGRIVLPTLSTGTVSLAGGSRGSSSSAGPLDYSYNPSIYTVGAIPSAANANVSNLQANYLGQYATLAGAQSNSGRSATDLIKMMSGLPAGYQLPTNLT